MRHKFKVQFVDIQTIKHKTNIQTKPFKKKKNLRPIENMKRTSRSIRCTYHEHRALSHTPIMNIALYYIDLS
jgi:hypothetical protein